MRAKLLADKNQNCFLRFFPSASACSETGEAGMAGTDGVKDPADIVTMPAVDVINMRKEDTRVDLTASWTLPDTKKCETLDEMHL